MLSKVRIPSKRQNKNIKTYKDKNSITCDLAYL